MLLHLMCHRIDTLSRPCEATKRISSYPVSAPTYQINLDHAPLSTCLLVDKLKGAPAWRTLASSCLNMASSWPKIRSASHSSTPPARALTTCSLTTNIRTLVGFSSCIDRRETLLLAASSITREARALSLRVTAAARCRL